MKIFKRILTLNITLFVIIIILSSCSPKYLNSNLNMPSSAPVNVGVLLYSFDDTFTNLLRKNFEQIEKKNPNKVKFSFFDGKGNLSIQQELLQNIIQSNFDLVVGTFDDKKEGILEDIIFKAKQKNIPIILFNASITNPNIIKTYNKALIINTNVEQSGVEQGNIIVDAWNTDKKSIDKNRDNILQYVILQGNPDSYTAMIRTKAVIDTINAAGIKTEPLALLISNWDKELAKTDIASLFLRYGNKIEAIISNNDAMAIGAVEALQKYGYNLGNKSKTIAVVGIDAIPEAQEMVKKGYLLGTILQDPHAMAEAVYEVGMNLVAGKKPTEDTNYKFDKSGVEILLPYQPYTAKSIPEVS